MAILLEAESVPKLREKIAEMEKDGYSVRGKIVHSADGQLVLVMMDYTGC